MGDKTGMVLTETRIAGGVWEGVLGRVKGDAPAVEALHGSRVVEGVEVQPLPGKEGRFAVRVPIPAWAVNDGVQTFLIQVGGVTLGQFTLIAGQPLDDDFRAELGLLRAELDLLKRAFQRHCRES
jgi:hypothetical protein